MNTVLRYRFPILFVVGVGLVIGAFLSERSRQRDLGAVRRAATPEPVRGSLGPTPGPDAEGYVTEKKSYLRSDLTMPAQPAAALVSLSRQLRPAETERLIAPGRADVLFLRFPGGSPEVLSVSGTVAVTYGSRAERYALQLESDAKQLEALAQTAPEADKRTKLQQSSAKRLDAAEVRKGCACIYALVVSGTTVKDLQTLQAKPEARLVDVPKPVVPDLSGWELRPLLPRA